MSNIQNRHKDGDREIAACARLVRENATFRPYIVYGVPSVSFHGIHRIVRRMSVVSEIGSASSVLPDYRTPSGIPWIRPSTPIRDNMNHLVMLQCRQKFSR
jgi:hypothetical protein